MASDWRDNDYEERPSAAPSFLGDGEEAQVRFLNDGYQEETRNGTATVFGVQILEAPTEATDMNGDPIEEGEEYNVYTDSSRLLGQLKDFAEDLEGQEATVTAHGDKNSFDRTYTVGT